MIIYFTNSKIALKINSKIKTSVINHKMLFSVLFGQIILIGMEENIAH